MIVSGVGESDGERRFDCLPYTLSSNGEWAAGIVCLANLLRPTLWLLRRLSFATNERHTLVSNVLSDQQRMPFVRGCVPRREEEGGERGEGRSKDGVSHRDEWGSFHHVDSPIQRVVRVLSSRSSHRTGGVFGRSHQVFEVAIQSDDVRLQRQFEPSRCCCSRGVRSRLKWTRWCGLRRGGE